MRHGANVKRCKIDGCTTQARKNGLCVRHGAKTECKHEGCTNHAQKGGVCNKHGAKRECKHEGCTNHAQKGGVCKRHGAKVTSWWKDNEMDALVDLMRSEAAKGGNRLNRKKIAAEFLCNHSGRTEQQVINKIVQIKQGDCKKFGKDWMKDGDEKKK